MTLKEHAEAELIDLFAGDGYLQFKQDPNNFIGMTFYDFLIETKFTGEGILDYNLVSYQKSNNNLAEWFQNSFNDLSTLLGNEEIVNDFLKVSDFVNDSYKVEEYILENVIKIKFADVFEEEFPEIDPFDDEITTETMEEVHNYFATFKNEDANEIKLTM